MEDNEERRKGYNFRAILATVIYNQFRGYRRDCFAGFFHHFFFFEGDHHSSATACDSAEVTFSGKEILARKQKNINLPVLVPPVL